MNALVQGAASGLGYAALGAALILIIGTTGRFHFAIGANFVIGAYAGVAVSAVAPWPLAILAGMVAAGVSGVLMEIGPYERVERAAPASALLNVFVVAFSLMVLVEGALRLLLPEQGGVRRITGFTDGEVSLLGLKTTELNVYQTVYVLAAFAIVWLLLTRTGLGLRIRGVRSNRALAETQGVSPRAVHASVFLLGCGLVGGLAVLAAMRTSATPSMGLTPAFYGFVIAFLAGLDRSFLAALVPGLAVGILERQLLNVLTPSQGQVTVFAVIFVLLALRASANSRWLAVRRARWAGRRTAVLQEVTP